MTRLLKILVLLAAVPQLSNAQWYKKQFVIGTFADPRVSRDNNDYKDSISFQYAKSAYINLLTGPQYHNGGRDYSLMNRTLELASKFNMRLLLIDSKLRVADPAFKKEEAMDIIKHFKSVDKSKRDAIAGYYFSGEYPSKNAEQVAYWTGFFKSNDPDKMAYSYLLPSYAFKTREEYEQYLNKYLTSPRGGSRPEVIAYDHYPFSGKGPMSSYFYNLDIIRDKAGTKPFWFYTQTTTKKTGPDITPYQMRFMTYCPLAYGAKGVIYYTYESIPDNYKLNYWDAVIDRNGKPTAKYAVVKKMNEYLKEVAGPLVMRSKNIAAIHVSEKPTAEDLPANELLANNRTLVKQVSNENILLGVFKDNASTKNYLMIINKASDNTGDVQITVAGRKRIAQYPQSDSYNGSLKTTPLKASYNGQNNTSSFTIKSLGGGEMTIVEMQ